MSQISEAPEINDAFTTESKTRFLRGHGVIRQKSLRFVSVLQRLGYVHEVPLEKAKDLFQLHVDTWDRASLKAYFGQLPGKTERIIDRTAHYATGTISVKKIRLRQDHQKTEGYLEKLGLATYEMRGEVWFLLLKEVSLVPEIAPSPPSVDESSLQGSGSKANFSLTHKPDDTKPLAPVNESQRRESVIGCERNRLSESILSTYLSSSPRTSEELSPAEKAAVEARDRKKLQSAGEKPSA